MEIWGMPGIMPATSVTIREALYRILDSIKQLPSPPEVCLAVTRATQDEATTLADLEFLVANDIALSGRLMQVANSAFFGIREPVTSVRRAISLLGFGTVRSLALGFFFNEEFGKLQLPGLPYPDLPRYALASSVAAESIAQEVAPELAADAACLGLLHESGVIVMAMAFGAQYRRMATGMAQRGGQLLAQAESTTFGVDHVLAGKLLLQGWRLSDAFVEGVAHHHEDHLPADTDPAIATMWRIIRVAGDVALLFFSADEPEVSVAVAETARSILDWQPSQCAQVLSEAARLYEQRMIITGISASIIAHDTQTAMGACERLLSRGSAA